MKASEMYHRSMIAYKGLPPHQELPPRLLSILARNQFIEYKDGKEPQLKTEKLRQAITTGTIWEVRNIGKTYVRLLCEWLEQKDTSNAPPEEQQT